MIILLYGKEEYLARKKLWEIWEAYGASGKTGFSAKRLGVEQISLEELRNELQSHSLFQEKKLLVLEDVFGIKEFKEHIANSVESLAKNPSLILVLLERGKILASDSLLKALQKVATVHEYKELDAAALDRWIVREGKALGVEIAKDARTLLMQEAGHDLWRLSQELAKLAAFKQGQTVEKQDVAMIIPEAALVGDIFVMLNSIAAKNKTKAFSLLHRHIAKGESPVYLLSMLHFQVRSLLEAKEQGSGWKARDAANFSSEELKNMHGLLLQADFAMKTGQMEPEAALDTLLTNVFSGGGPDETFFSQQYSF
ncbi:MAG: DNA polymerase III subunit delta [Parcubacteria group bacterium]|nr:DNA polymerase III subunit delta [Parcubacteria group bacterium]